MVTPMRSDFLGTTDAIDPILHLRNLKQKKPKLLNCIMLQSQASNKTQKVAGCFMPVTKPYHGPHFSKISLIVTD